MDQPRELVPKPKQPMEDNAPWASPDVREALDPFVPHEEPETQNAAP